MTNWQTFLIFIYSLYAFSGIVKGYIECKNKKNAFGASPFYTLLGAWVWGDVLVFGVFWLLVSLSFIFIFKNWHLYLLTQSVFWTVRSFGEINYWMNQQFSTINRNPPKNLLFHDIFHNDSIWFVYQTIWQCLGVIGIILSIYFTYLWTSSF